jgi:MFS family permease
LINEPPTPKRPRIFYGWYIIALSGLSAAFAGTTSQAFFGVFLKPIEDETGWSRTAIAGAVTLATFVGGGIAVFVGRLADRYGPRFLMTIGVVIYSVGYTSMLIVTQVWQLYIAYFLARMASLQLLAGVVPRTATVNWFRRKRGRALGFQQMAMPLGGAALAALAGILIADGVEWRHVLGAFGIVAFLVLAVPMPLIMRRQPEDLGLLPDGDAAPTDEADTSVQERHRGTEESWTLRESLRTPAMWLVCTGSLIQTMASGGIAFLMPAYFESTGLSTQIAASGAAVFLLGGAFSSSLWGFLTERYDERLLVVAATGFAMFLAIYGSFVSGAFMALSFALFYGATTRGEGALVMMMLAAYYGRRSHGTISGFANTFTMMGLGIGPLLYSQISERTNSFTPVFYTSATLLGVATVLMYLAKRPMQKPTAPTPEPQAI